MSLGLDQRLLNCGARRAALRPYSCTLSPETLVFTRLSAFCPAVPSLINCFVPLKNNRFLRSVLEKTPDHWNSDRLLLTMRLTKEITSFRLYLSYPPTTTFINPFDRWV